MDEVEMIFENGEFRLCQRSDELWPYYLIRQADAHVSVANRARQIMLIRGLQKRERAWNTIRRAQDALAELNDDQRVLAGARLRRMLESLDWTES